jgi:hypothetical protein
MDGLLLQGLSGRLEIGRPAPAAAMPDWGWRVGLVSVTRTPDEPSVVCDEAAVPAAMPLVERGWRALRVAGTLDFALAGILARLAAPLAEAGISIFALSTFDTDYLLVRASDLDAAIDALRAAGHEVTAQP